MINILYVILSFEIGGMEQMVADLILALDRSRFNPVVVCLKSLGPIAAELEKKRVKIIKLDPMTPLVSFLYPKQLVDIIKNLDINVVHTHSGAWHKAAIAGFWGGVKNVIYTDHGRFYPDSRKLIVLDRMYAPFTKHVVCVSGALAEYMADTVGISKTKISCIINGVDESKLETARTPQKDVANRIGIIARLAAVKDVATLIQAMKILRDKGTGATLTIAGDGPERGSLEQLTKLLGISDAVKFLGFRRDIPEIIAEIDIFVLSSLSEGTSLTLLEAMAAGKPVVATNVGGNPAIVKDEENGLLVPPAKPSALSDALYRLIMDKEMRERMSTANICAIRDRYSLRRMASEYEKLYAG